MSDSSVESTVKNKEMQLEQMEEGDHLPQLNWDFGTAYDLFISLNVLHNPDEFGLRASWAAGVRNRLSAQERKTLEEADGVVSVPFHWIYTLPEPKDGANALWSLSQLPAEERVPKLALYPRMPEEMVQIYKDVAARGSWDEGQLEALRSAMNEMKAHKGKPKDKELRRILDVWAKSEEFGERYLQALRSYYQSFFTEEERTITPALRSSLADAKNSAEDIPLLELLEKLSQGLHLPGLLEDPQLLLVPSYWATPLTYFGEIDDETSVMTFGARPSNVSLVPGEVVPDALLRTLKAIADPTRLRILRYLIHEQLVPAELSRRLRLRAPTVTHHLRSLRLAGLVHIDVTPKAEGKYAARLEAIQGMCEMLDEFLESDLEGLEEA